jgi:hypothetical protein
MSNTKLALVVSLALCLPAYAESPLAARLTVVPAAVLPGLPAAFLVTISNVSNRPQQVFDGAVLSVTDAAGSYEAAVNGRSGFNLPTGQLDNCGGNPCLNMGPSTTRELYFDFTPSLAGNPFFLDPRLSSVGAHELKLTLAASGDDGSEVEVSTQTAMLTIQQPQGAEADAWAWLAQQAGTTSPALAWALRGPDLASELRARFPTSQYTIWAAALGGATKEEQLGNIDRALQSGPPAGLRDMLLFAKASLLVQWNHVAIHSFRDLQLALTYADAATTALTTLRESAVSSYMRDRAAKLIDNLYTTKTGQAVLRDLAALDPSAPLAVVPRVECVSVGSGRTFNAKFGYSNPNRAQKVIPLGNANQITPAPRDQQQPRVFKPGDHASVFTASSPGGELKWHLDGSDAVATADFPVQCAARP